MPIMRPSPPPLDGSLFTPHKYDSFSWYCCLFSWKSQRTFNSFFPFAPFKNPNRLTFLRLWDQPICSSFPSLGLGRDQRDFRRELSSHITLILSPSTKDKLLCRLGFFLPLRRQRRYATTPPGPLFNSWSFFELSPPNSFPSSKTNVPSGFEVLFHSCVVPQGFFRVYLRL